MRPHDMTGVNFHIAFIAKQNMHHNIWFVESSHTPALWRHDQDSNHENMVFLLIFQGRLAMFMEENSTSKCNVDLRKSMSI